MPVESDQVACLLSTSGTTGKPKEVMLTHNNILFSERVFTSELGRTQGDVMFMPSPLNHATGFFHGLISRFCSAAGPCCSRTSTRARPSSS